MKGKEIRIVSLLVLDTVFFLLEAIVGYTVHSLALVADSFHMLNDIISLFIALWAVKVKNTKLADDNYTYGWQRAEILGALINAVFLLALCFTIVIEAIQRLISPPTIDNPVLVLVVGCAGLVSNFIGLVLFHEHGHSHGHSHSHDTQPEEAVGETSRLIGRNPSSSDFRQYIPENFISRFEENHQHEQPQKKKRSMNMEGVFLHVMGDALGNIGVIISALIIWKTKLPGRFYSDPIISLVITVIIFSTALPLCKRSSKILLQASPTNVSTSEIIKEILKLNEVKSVHDFHVWNLNEDILIASLHLELIESHDSSDFSKPKFLEIVTKVREILHKFNIHSVTIQPEFYNRQLDEVVCAVDDASNCFNGNCLKIDEH